MIALKGPLMNKKDYAANFPLKHAQKDMRFALALGDKVRCVGTEDDIDWSSLSDIIIIIINIFIYLFVLKLSRCHKRCLWPPRLTPSTCERKDGTATTTSVP